MQPWHCIECNKLVFPDPKTGLPASKYWHPRESKVTFSAFPPDAGVHIVFCGPECSLIYHERSNGNPLPFLVDEESSDVPPPTPS